MGYVVWKLPLDVPQFGVEKIFIWQNGVPWQTHYRQLQENSTWASAWGKCYDQVVVVVVVVVGVIVVVVVDVFFVVVDEMSLVYD